jgi:hypothetical protein
MLGIAASLWSDHLLRQAGRADLVQPTTNALPWLLALMSAPTVGAVLATRRSRHPVGWLLLGLGASIGLTGFTDGYALYGLLARPGWLPAARWTAMYGPAVAVAGIGCLGFVLLLTPTGSLPSPRWRWWARVAAAAPVVYLVALTLTPEPLDSFYRPLVTNPLGLRAPLELPIKITRAAVGVTVVAVPVGTLSLVVRFRRVRGTERQQLRWVALAALLAALAILMALAGMITGNTAMRNWGIGVSFAVLHRRSAPRSCATGSMTWTVSSAAPWPMGCSRCCWLEATPWSCWGLDSCWAATPAWSSPPRPWPWRQCSSRHAAGSKHWWTAASTAAATTPPAPSPRSAAASATRSTWAP